MGRLNGRVAAVTGGAAGIGEAIVKLFAEEGASVGFADLDGGCGATVAQEAGALFVPTRVEREAEAAAFIERTAAHFGGLDILVNNASIFEKIPLDEMTSDAAQMMWRVNAEAPLMLIQHAAPHLRFEGKDDPGSVINMIDNSSGRNDWPELSHYCASKAALLSMTRSLAQELAPSIRVNAVGPGAILFQDWESEDRRSAVLSSIPMGRQGNTDEIAETVLFLAAGPSYITGQIIDVDGGWSLTT